VRRIRVKRRGEFRTGGGVVEREIGWKDEGPRVRGESGVEGG